jgi:uncharacterized protein (TIGR03546 family)
MLNAVVKFFKTLNSNSHPDEIAHAVCLGFILGLMPKDNALWYIALVFSFFLRINRGALLLCTAFFALVAPVFDTLLDAMGYWVLTLKPASGAFRALLDIPFVAFTKFNNSIVMGSIALGAVAYLPLYFAARLLVGLWRKTAVQKIAASKAYGTFLKLPLVSRIAGIAASLDKKELL